jgi:hypothetical protein
MCVLVLSTSEQLYIFALYIYYTKRIFRVARCLVFWEVLCILLFVLSFFFICIVCSSNYVCDYPIVLQVKNVCGHIFIWGIKFAFFYDFSIVCWNCSDSAELFCFSFYEALTNLKLIVKFKSTLPHSRLTTGFVTRLTRRVPLVEQKLFTLQEHLISPPVLVGFVLLDL